jgi:hypothetical protein
MGLTWPFQSVASHNLHHLPIRKNRQAWTLPSTSVCRRAGVNKASANDRPQTNKHTHHHQSYNTTSTMEHLQRIIAVHSPGVYSIVADNARRHKHTATGSAEVLPALWQFAKAHRRRRNSSSSSSSQNNNSHNHEALPADLRWAAQETTTTMSTFSPKPHGTMRTLKQSLPTPPLVCQSPCAQQRSSPMSPGGSPRDFMSTQSPKRPQRQPSAGIIIDPQPTQTRTAQGVSTHRYYHRRAF